MPQQKRGELRSIVKKFTETRFRRQEFREGENKVNSMKRKGP